MVKNHFQALIMSKFTFLNLGGGLQLPQTYQLKADLPSLQHLAGISRILQANAVTHFFVPFSPFFSTVFF